MRDINTEKDMINAARFIGDTCRVINCEDCIFSNFGKKTCFFYQEKLPIWWNLDKVAKSNKV